MGLISGSYFKIGDSHEICQDYSIDYSDEEGAVAVLADGCSSNTHSDIGARLLAYSASNQIADHKDITSPQEIIYNSKFLMDNLRLHHNHLNATLLTVSAFKEHNLFSVNVFGDGVIVAREKETKELHVIELNYPSGAPFYLQYLLEADLLERWTRERGETFEYTYTIIKPDGTFEPRQELIQNTLGIDESFHFDDYDLVAVLSDGIKSFRHIELPLLPHGNTMKCDVPYLEVIKKLFEFKLMGGVFVERRCNKFFKECKELNWSHYDDFSIAAVYRSEPENKS